MLGTSKEEKSSPSHNSPVNVSTLILWFWIFMNNLVVT